MEPWTKHIVLSQHQVVVLTCEVIFNTSYRMSRHPFPTLQVVEEICLEFIYGDHKEAPSIIESVTFVDLSKQGIGNQTPMIRCIIHFGIFDGVSRDKMQNLKVRCKTIPLMVNFTTRLGLLFRVVPESFILNTLFIFWRSRTPSPRKLG